jgi:4-hydroxy-tetrahydrodipicolinate reductase
MSFDGSEGRHRVAIVGLGKQGLLLIERLARRNDVELIGVVDVAPAKVGRHVDEIADRRTGFDLYVSDSLDSVADADVALVTTTSRLHAVSGLIEELAVRSVHTVSTCEEMGYPWRQFPEESRRIDELARANGVAVIGCGANPGFLMDLVPITFAFGCERVDSITISRTLDMRPHRPERLTRFALGLTPEELAALDEPPTGHVGFTQSIDCVADALGWQLDRRVESPIRPVALATDPRHGEHLTVGPGGIAVIEHSACGYRGHDKLIELTMYFGFHSDEDPLPHADVYHINASDHPIRIEMAPSWSPFSGTPSTVMNMIGPIRTAPAGLRCVTEFEPRVLAASGRAVDATSPLPVDDYLAALAIGA